VQPTDEIYKALIPNFLYKPAFGYPLNKDVPEIRRLAKTPFVSMVVNTICDEIASMDWDCKARDGKEDEVPEEIIEKTKNFFYNPNSNDESLEQILRKGVRDLLEIDAMVVNKIWNLKDEFVGIMVYDGGTFTKNPDIHGAMPEYQAYFQYGWSTGARPIPFDKKEIIYIMRNPRADTIYGQSPVENLLRVVQMLQYGIDSNLEYFTDNMVPKGVFKMPGAIKDDVTAFYQAFSEIQKKKDEAGNWRKIFYKMPVINTNGEFERISFSNVELDLIAQQQWFSKLVWANFGVTPSEMGFTEDSNRATEIVQSSASKRKSIKPILNLLEYYFDTEIINDLPWIKGKYEDMVLFEFEKFDISSELAQRQVYWGDIDHKLVTPNEIREEMHMTPLPGGDAFDSGFSDTMGSMLNNQKNGGPDAQRPGGEEDEVGGTSSEPEAAKQATEEQEIKKKAFDEAVAETTVRNMYEAEIVFPTVGGKADGKKITDFDEEKLIQGMKVESEHTSNAEEAVKIAADHLMEFSDYYDRLRLAEKKNFKKKNSFKALNASNAAVLKPFEEPANADKMLGEHLDAVLEEIIKLIQREAGEKTVQEIKALDNGFVQRIIALLSVENFKQAMNDFIKHYYYKGLTEAEQKIEVNMNFVPNQAAIDFLQNYSFGLIRDLSEETRNDLRAELQRGILQGEGSSKLAKRVKEVMETSKKRAIMIARTESSRAENMGTLEAYKQSGLKGKKVFIATKGDRTCEICKNLDGKEILLDAKFKYKGEEWFAPPVHPSCRCAIAFVPEK
jgi:SPP1 gp7 family putative phage head morphogenesis protein